MKLYTMLRGSWIKILGLFLSKNWTQSLAVVSNNIRYTAVQVQCKDAH